MKQQRHTAIGELLVKTAATNQDELRRRLAGRGFHVTQATVSRDIHELRLATGPDGYSLPGGTDTDEDALAREPLEAPKTAVGGGGGFGGGELARLLLNHPGLSGAKPIFFGRAGESEAGTSTYLEDLHPQLAVAGDTRSNPVLPFSWDRAVDSGVEVLFLATPHEQSREWAPEAIARGIKVVDLSGAWRLQETRNRDV